MATESAEGPPLRSSGRVRKRPETMYGSSPSIATSKRKHDETDGVLDEESEDSSEEEAEEDDFIVAPRAKSKAVAKKSKEPVQKRPRTNGATTLTIRTANQKPRKAAKPLSKEAEAAGGMFADIFTHGVPMDSIVSDWLARFEEDDSGAFAELINLILRAAGCESSITSEQVQDHDAITDYIADLQQEYQASNPTDYPLMAKGRKAAALKQGIAKFIDVLVKSIASNGLLFTNEVLMEYIHSWFSTMSTAANRPFRHTATVVSLLCTTTLCEVANEMTSDAARAQKQAETERKKSAKNKARVSEMDKKVEDANAKLAHVDALVKDFYDTVFIHRYKDIDAAIRRECAASLGDWITTLPNVYLDGTHLRYLGWMLSDSHPSVRLEAVKQILRFYQDHDMINGMKAFTERFRPRLVEMATSDADTNVRMTAIELLHVLRANGLLEAEDIDNVGRLIFESDEKIRKATALFLAEGINDLYSSKVEELGGVEALEEDLPAASPDDSGTPQLTWLKYKCLAEILQAYQPEELLPKAVERPRLNGTLILNAAGIASSFSLATEDIREHLAEINNWRVLAGYLLFESISPKKRAKNDPLLQFKKECTLASKEEVILLNVLHVGVRHEIKALAEKLSLPKSKVSNKQRAQQQEELEAAAADLLALLPRLLERYGDVPETASIVLHIQQTLGLEAVQELGHESAKYNELLEKVKRQFLSHTTEAVLESAADLLLQAKAHSDYDEAATDKLSGIWDALVLNFVQLVSDVDLKQRGSLRLDDLQALDANLSRMLNLASRMDITAALEDEESVVQLGLEGDQKALVECLVSIMARGVHGRRNNDPSGALEDQIAQSAAEILLYYFRWSFVSVKDKVEGRKTPELSLAELEALAPRRDEYADAINAVLSVRKPREPIFAAYASYMLDLHLASSTLITAKRSATATDDYMVFLIDLETESQEVIMKAFAGAEAVFAALGRKQLQSGVSTSQEFDAELDDVDADPLSDDDEEDEETPAFQQKQEARMIQTILAEQRLCQLTSKIIVAVLGGLMEKKHTRRRVEQNKQKLGHNFREACKYFDLGAVREKKAKASAPNPKAPSRKANAIDAESEHEDEIEDDASEAQHEEQAVAAENDAMED